MTGQRETVLREVLDRKARNGDIEAREMLNRLNQTLAVEREELVEEALDQLLASETEPYREVGQPYGHNDDGLRRWKIEIEAAYLTAGSPLGPLKENLNRPVIWALEQHAKGVQVWGNPSAIFGKKCIEVSTSLSAPSSAGNSASETTTATDPPSNDQPAILDPATSDYVRSIGQLVAGVGVSTVGIAALCTDRNYLDPSWQVRLEKIVEPLRMVEHMLEVLRPPARMRHVHRRFWRAMQRVVTTFDAILAELNAGADESRFAGLIGRLAGSTTELEIALRALGKKLSGYLP